MEVKGTGR